MAADDLDSSGVRRALQEDARSLGHEGAEAVYRSVSILRDQLPRDTRLHVTIMLDGPATEFAGLRTS